MKKKEIGQRKRETEEKIESKTKRLRKIRDTVSIFLFLVQLLNSATVPFKGPVFVVFRSLLHKQLRTLYALPYDTEFKRHSWQIFHPAIKDEAGKRKRYS